MICNQHGSLHRAGLPLALLFLLGSVVGLGCDDERAPLSARPGSGRGPGGGTPTEASGPPVPIPGVAGQLPTDARRARRSAPTFPPEPGAGSTGRAAAVDEEDDQADADPLPSALRQAFGSPTSCISEATRDRLGETLHVHVSVRVTPSGRLASANVSSSQLSAEDLECMQRHALALHLPSPIANAPRTVATEVEYRVQDGRVSTQVQTGPPPRTPAPGTVAAGATLPAGGTETARPTGFVAPGSTLPVGGTATERPAGFVAPSSTLPAVAP